MRRNLFLPTLSFLLCAGTMLHAAPKKTGSAAAAAKKKAELEAAAAARKAANDAFVAKHYAALKSNLPNLHESDLKNISKPDLKGLYIKSYEASGMNMIQARQKAETVDLN